MRYLCLLMLLVVGSGEIIAQSTGKISYTISNGLQIAGVDGTNPVIYDNDWLMDAVEDAFIWLKAHNGEINLVGNINTRDMWDCSRGACKFSLQETFGDWTQTYAAAQQMGLRNIPAPVRGSNEILIKPASGRIEDTRYNVSDGSELILREAQKASVGKPLVVIVGGNPTSVANAYLKDPSIADKIVVMHVDGWGGHGRYNMTDNWGTYIVMKKLKYIMWDGDLNSWYPGKNVNITNEMINSIPKNPLTNTMDFFWNNLFATYHDIADAPPVLYLFNHSLWKNVQRRTEDNQPTTSDAYDFLIVSENDWQNYGPVFINYMSDPSNYLLTPAANIAPVVSITGPSNNSTITQGSPITLIATATDANGTIAKVEFYAGSTKLGEDATSPYSYTWNGAAPGNYSITAKATDNEGASTTSGAVSISVTLANTNPTINITSPGNNAAYPTGAAVTITAAASDNGGSISKVEFFNGTAKLGEALTSPYSFTWTNVPAGTFSLTAKATDNQGATTTSAVVTISVATVNTAPAVNITTPASNASFTAGASVTITATASDNGGSISKVEFFNGTTKLGEALTSPYSLNWTNVPAGTFSLTAKATDNQGATTTSSVVTISVATVNTAPAVNITAPANNASYNQGSAIIISANATDANGTISKVEFYTGATKLGEDLTSPYSYTWNSATTNLGNHFITAKATDNQGASTTSAGVSISVTAANTNPTVSITSPVTNASYTAGATVTINATAADNGGAVSKVEFFNGTSKLGEDLTSPYGFSWTNVPAGTFSLTAKATDNLGATTTSAVVTISVAAANTAPVVNITTPANNASYNQGATITISANATDANGTISKVEFYTGATKLGEDLTSPYSYTWNSATTNLGNHFITAKATDNQGASTTSGGVSISVTAANTNPTVSITSPVTNASYAAGATVTINATAADNGGAISKVEFFNGTSKLGEDLTSPYSFTWTNLPAGTFSLTAKATDNQGATTTSAVVTISVATVNTAPTVSITSPANNASYNQGSSITISANATDANGTISKVEFYTGATKLGEDLTSPYSYTWNSATTNLGNHFLTAKATDNQGASTTSGGVSISVVAANTNPTVSITSPVTNASYTAGATATINATAADNGGAVSKVEFFNGTSKLGEDLTSPYSFSWTNVPAGTFSLTAKATDNLGATTTSAVVTISVAAANTAPVVNITTPANNASYNQGATITISANATDANGTISKVEFYTGAIKLGEDATSPYSYTWNSATTNLGNHFLTAKATDNEGASTTSAGVSISVTNTPPIPGAPLVALTSPTNNASFQPETSITLSATASQANGSITKVEFFNGSTKLGEDLSAPYSIEWTNAPSGTLSLSAKATDTNNLTSTSAVVVITVSAPNVPPVVNIVTPENKAVINANASISITAHATDPNGSVTKVEFYNGSVKLGEDLTSPYNHDWTTSSPGVYVIVAKAVDNHGMTAAHQILVTVNPSNKPPLASAGNDITTHLPAEETLIQGIGTDPEEGVLAYSWTQVSGPGNATLTPGMLGELVVSNLVEGTYVFELVVSDNGDLTAKDQMTLIVLPPNSLFGQVPRYFTPNNDGMNDFWEWPDIELYENALLTIFNRVGQKVYESTSYQNNWNGNVDGRPLQADAYYYIIRLGNTALKGAVRIIR